MKIIVMGASGMLGHLLYSELKKNHETWGTVRDKKWHPDLLDGYDVYDLEKIEKLISLKKPDYVINCIGIIKQLKASEDKIISLEVNSLWPHKLAAICERQNSKMIHFSTDCVFAGTKGNYLDSDFADARDTYGLTKYMGEVDYPHTLTLRTSIIGHELNSKLSLVDWFLSQQNECKGFSKAIFSGFPTIVMARFLENYIFNNFISGIYNFSSEPINKFELLQLVAREYKKNIKINPSEELIIDRSLNSDKLRKMTGFTPQAWPVMIEEMYRHFVESGPKQL
jgi:dTDP-4-dehydrorhamnose reductase